MTSLASIAYPGHGGNATDAHLGIVGLDVGTQGTRAIAVTGEGQVLADALPRYVTTPDIRMHWPGDAAPALKRIAAAFPAERVSRLDGVRVQFPERWGLVRSSVTEAALAPRFEGPTPEAPEAIVSAFLAATPDLEALVRARLSLTPATRHLAPGTDGSTP